MNRIYLILIVLLVSIFTAKTQTVTVEWNDVRQRIDGFGASDAWFADEIMQHPDKSEMLDLLFSRESGAGLSILRHRITPNESDWIDGGMTLTSGDLDFGDQPVNGVRFTNLQIPQGATIDAAFIQFTAKDNRSDPSELKITAQAADNAPAFTDTPENISSRPQTEASILWNVPAWYNNQRVDAQKTPDLSSLVQEVVSRDGWQSGNSIVFVIQNSTGKRSARSFDDDGGLDVAPELTVEFNSTESISKKVNASLDDAEEEGTSYFSYGAMATQEAFARGCEIVWAAAWTPPAKWKTNNDPQRGGYLEQQHYQDFADYLEQYRAEMEQRSGFPMYGISPQNEPGYKSWESCQWDKNDFRDFVKNNLGPTLDSSCRIIVPEETNWNNVDNFYNPIHNDPAARAFVDIVAGHVYGGDPNVSYNQFGKPVWETEWSYDTSKDDLTINNGLVWAHNFWKLLVNAEVSACHHWWLINMHNDGRQQALISASPGVPGFKVAKRLWTIGNYSKFVRPGWQRIDATKNPVSDVYIAAFKDSSTNEFAIVAINQSDDDQDITFNLDGFYAESITPHRTSNVEDLRELESLPADSAATVTLQAKSVTTFVGSGSLGTSVSKQGQQIQPTLFSLMGNYPNPFNPSTTIRYSLTKPAEVVLEIYDINGRKIETLVSERQQAGEYNVQWNTTTAKNIASGVYIYRLYARSGEQIEEQHRKMLLVK